MPYLVSFSGLPGVGKTTIARALAREKQAVYIRVDSIETGIKESALRPASVEDAGYQAAFAVARDNLANGLNVVADTVNPVEISRQAWTEVARVCNALLLDVEVVCSDPVEHRRRVESRVSDIEGLEQPTWQDVQDRHYEAWAKPRLVLDTALLTTEECLSKIADAIGEQAYSRRSRRGSKP
ncbi:MAG: AAA family ATPase [Pseudomonadota bacterium]